MADPLSPVELHLLKRLASELISHSERFETVAPTYRKDVIGGLARLSDLNEIANASLHPSPIATVATAELKPYQGSILGRREPNSATPAQYSSERHEYKPALKDLSLVQALLDYHRQSSLAPQPANPRLRPGFSQAQAPQVAAEPKRHPIVPHQPKPSGQRVMTPTRPKTR